MTNTGDTRLPLADIEVRFGKNDNTRFDSWGQAALGAGTCYRFHNNAEKAEDEIEEKACTRLADAVGEIDWKKDIRVFYKGEEMGSCEVKKDDDLCAISFSE